MKVICVGINSTTRVINRVRVCDFIKTLAWDTRENIQLCVLERVIKLGGGKFEKCEDVWNETRML